MGRGKTYIGIAGIILAVELMGVPTWLAVFLLFVSLFFLAWGIAPAQTRKIVDRVPILNISVVLDRLDRIIESPHRVDNRLSRVKHKLGDFWTEAEAMRQKAQDKKIETQSLQEPEKAESLSNWDVPDCSDWHKRTYEFIETEIGTHKAMEFSKRYRVLNRYDLNEPGFIASFFRKRQDDLSKINDNLKEEDLSCP